MNGTHRWASFTLVEMLVAMAVFSLLILLLFSIMSNASWLWRQQSAKEEGFREARAALDTLSRDMSTALRSTNVAWFYSSASQLAFLTTLPDAAQGVSNDHGDICAVGYSLEWSTNDASSTQTNMSLYRYVRFSDPTYTTIINGADSVDDIFENPPGTSTVRELIARNVSQFSVDFYTNDASGAPVRLSNPSVLPNLLNVSITTLNDNTAKLLPTEAQWKNTNSVLIQQNAESFTLRVRPQAP